LNLLNRIKTVATPATAIPKPYSRGRYVVVGWRLSRGEEALIYLLPVKARDEEAVPKAH
jgi:hypothetical protein